METGKKQQSMLNGAFVLILAVALVKVIGVLFKMPMTSILGPVGRGYFNSAYEIYTPIFAISMAGLPVAVSRMVAERVALKQYREARTIFLTSKKIFFIVGVAGTLVLLICAYPYARWVANIKTLAAVLCVAPSIFLCCYMSAYRGYYEGLRNMTPTAISQVIEALGKLVIGLAFIKSIMSIGLSQYTAGMAESGDKSAVVFGTTCTTLAEANSAIYPWAAAGAVLGVTMGSLFSLLFLMLCHKKKGDNFTLEMVRNSPEPAKSTDLSREMIKIAIPMVISALILNITNLIDTTTIQARLTSAVTENYSVIREMYLSSISDAINSHVLDESKSEDIVKFLWGSYGTALDFKTLVPTITIQLGVSAIPALAAAWAVKNKDDMRSTIETVLRVGMLIALPAGIGMAALAEPILTIIYGRGESACAIPIIAPILVAYGLFTPLIAISTPTTNMLQAVGRPDIPMKTVAGAAIVKILCNFILVGMPKVNIKGAVIGTVVFYVIIVCINMFFLLKISKVKVNWFSVFLKPFIAAALCGVTAYATHGIIAKIFPCDTSVSVLNYDTLGTIAGIGLGALVYLATILLLRGIAEEDLKSLPKGEKIAKVLAKYRLLG